MKGLVKIYFMKIKERLYNLVKLEKWVGVDVWNVIVNRCYESKYFVFIYLLMRNVRNLNKVIFSCIIK